MRAGCLLALIAGLLRRPPSRDEYLPPAPLGWHLTSLSQRRSLSPPANPFCYRAEAGRFAPAGRTGSLMDVFLSYNRRDATHAAALNTWLGSQSVTTFFDQRDLDGGKLWLPDLERRIEHDAQAVAVLVGPAGLGNTQQYEYQLALTRQAADPAFSVIPVILPGTPDWRVPRGFLGLLNLDQLRRRRGPAGRPDRPATPARRDGEAHPRHRARRDRHHAALQPGRSGIAAVENGGSGQFRR